jgi:predicted TIM-barrel fold metal-dependent hydrolase
VSGTGIFAEPKVDCHVHILDPQRFPYGANTHYAPAGQEMGTRDQLLAVMDAYGTRHALLVGPNSGYALDNRCMLDAVARSPGRFRGIAVVRNDATLDELAALKSAGVIGVAWNVTFHGIPYYAGAAPLLARLRELDLCVSVQVEHDQMVTMAPLLRAAGVRILVDHCGRPTTAEGMQQAGFAAVRALADTGRAYVKLSGVAKITPDPYPYLSAQPYIDALLDAFTPARCLWASDWPHLRAPSRMDYGVLLRHVEHVLPDPAVRRQVLWDTPREVLGFS